MISSPTIAARLAAAAALALLAAPARAADEPRFYGALDVGGHWPGTIDSSSTKDAPDGRPYDWRWGFRSGVAIDGRLGLRLTRHVRVEGEFSFEPTEVTSAHAPGADAAGVSASRPGEPWGLCGAPTTGAACASLDGHNKYHTADYLGMANVIYDVAPERRLQPFFGAGAGLAHIQMHTTYWFSGIPGASAPTPQMLELAGTLTRPSEVAVQGLAGLSYRLARRLHLDLTYRYAFTPAKVVWNPLNDTPVITGETPLEPGNFFGRFTDQTATVGLRYAF